MIHRIVDAAGVRIHLVEHGTGPLVLLVHGFPESWFSWRHQLPVLADAGYRAVAIDVRGYGRSARPDAVDAYRMLAHIGDNVGVVEAVGEREAVIVGHDWGSAIASYSALVRPDVFGALVTMSTPHRMPGGSLRPSERFAAMGGDEEFYISYFQEPGRAEAEIESDVRGWLAGLYVSSSADRVPSPDGRTPATVPPGGRMRDRFVVPDPLPAWLGDDVLDHYAAAFGATGFTGALNRYRNMDADAEDLRAFAGVPVTVPSLFIGGDHDAATIWGAADIENFGASMPGLRGSHILERCGHWPGEEQPERVNELLVGFLDGL